MKRVNNFLLVILAITLGIAVSVMASNEVRLNTTLLYHYEYVNEI